MRPNPNATLNGPYFHIQDLSPQTWRLVSQTRSAYLIRTTEIWRELMPHKCHFIFFISWTQTLVQPPWVQKNVLIQHDHLALEFPWSWTPGVNQCWTSRVFCMIPMGYIWRGVSPFLILDGYVYVVISFMYMCHARAFIPRGKLQWRNFQISWCQAGYGYWTVFCFRYHLGLFTMQEPSPMFKTALV